MPRRSRASRLDVDTAAVTAEPIVDTQQVQSRETTSITTITTTTSPTQVTTTGDQTTHETTQTHITVTEPGVGGVESELEFHEIPGMEEKHESKQPPIQEQEQQQEQEQEQEQPQLAHMPETETVTSPPSPSHVQSLISRIKSLLPRVHVPHVHVPRVRIHIPHALKRWHILTPLLLGILALSLSFLLPLLSPYMERLDVTHPNTVWKMPDIHIEQWIPHWISQYTTQQQQPPTPTPTTQTGPQIAIVFPIETIPIPVPVPVPIPESSSGLPPSSIGSTPSASPSPATSTPVPAPPPTPTSPPPSPSMLSTHYGVSLPVPLSSLMPAIDRLARLTKEQHDLLDQRPDLLTSDLLPPVSNTNLGRAVWTFLHTIAAAYPNEPTTTQQLQALYLIDAVANIYPCAGCHDNFKNFVALHPPDVSSKTAFSVWLCRAHNDINTRIGRPSVDCNPNYLGMLWPETDIGHGTTV